MTDQTPELRYMPPGQVFNKRTDKLLAKSGADHLLVTGGETDMCVLGAVLEAIDRGKELRL